jgi:hypothetical protein
MNQWITQDATMYDGPDEVSGDVDGRVDSLLRPPTSCEDGFPPIIRPDAVAQFDFSPANVADK